MLPADEIAEQEQLLATHRHTLMIYLEQQAEIGRAYSPPSLIEWNRRYPREYSPTQTTVARCWCCR
jgi:hypothetical protein